MTKSSRRNSNIALLFTLCLLAACLTACSYSRYPAQQCDDLIDPPPPVARWPRAYTDLPFLVAEPSNNTSAFSAYAHTPEPMSTVGEPIGSGWITYLRPVPVKGQAPKPPTSFRYHSWRDRPLILDTDFGTDTLASIAALQASAHFRLTFHLWLPGDEIDHHTDDNPLSLSEPSHEPRAVAAHPPIRGIILYQWGLSGYRWERALVEELLKEGWAVLSPNGLAWRWPGAVVITPEAPAASKIHTDRGVRPEALPLNKDELTRILSAAGSLAAADLDDAIGQYALATDAALEFVRRNYPQIPTTPLVVVGASFGGLMSPTLIRRLDENPATQVDAAVFIGAGANLLHVMGKDWADSYYSRTRTGRGDTLHLSPTKRDELYQSYLRASTLDPYHSIAAIRGRPMLMLHAAHDQMVPAKLGDLLWERAGRPERWVGPFGHIQMFITFSWHAEDLAKWINDNSKPK